MGVAVALTPRGTQLAEAGARSEHGAGGPAHRPGTATLQWCTFYISKLVILTASNLLIQED